MPHIGEWIINKEYLNYLFVAHAGMKKDLIKRGVNPDIIYVTGIPLSNKFLAHYDKESILSEFGLSAGKRTILFFTRVSKSLFKDKTYKLFKSLITTFPYVQVIAIAGRNEKTKEAFTSLVEKIGFEDTVKVLEYTDKIPELMSVSDLVVTKPRWINYY